MLCVHCSHTLSFNRLILCEKALAEYLETKRLAFPRFYFISSADLLDILSKGSRPKEVDNVAFPLFLVFQMCPVSLNHFYVYNEKLNDSMSFAGNCSPLKII